MPTALQTWQVEFNGLTAGGTADVQVVAVRGLDLPPMRVGNRPNPGRPGSLPGRFEVAERVVEVTFEVDADDATGFEAVSTALAVQADDDVEMRILQPHWDDERSVWCRPERLATGGWTIERALGFAYLTVQFSAADPYIYGPAQSSSAGIPVAPDGVAWPVTWPKVYPAPTGGDGLMTVQNDGNHPVGWTAEIAANTATLRDPVLTHVESGRQIVLRGLVLPAGQTVQVLNKATVRDVRQAGVSTSLAVAQSWFDLAPGANTIRFSSLNAAQAAGPTCSVAWRSGWSFVA